MAYTDGLQNDGAFTNNGSAYISSTLNVDGMTYTDGLQNDGAFTNNGSAYISNNLDVNGRTYTDGLTNDGDLDQNGNVVVDTGYMNLDVSSSGGANGHGYGQIVNDYSNDTRVYVDDTTAELRNYYGSQSVVEAAEGYARMSYGSNMVTANSSGVYMQDDNGADVYVENGGAYMNSYDGDSEAWTETNSAGIMLRNDSTNQWHGLEIDNSGTTLSGGTTSTYMTLDDNGVTLGDDVDAPVQIHGVAKGTHDTDAVNYGQLKDLERDTWSGIAAVAAMSSIPQPLDGHKFAVGMGAGNYKGETAVAFGASAVFGTNWVVKANIGFNNGEVLTGGAVGYSW